MQEAGVPGYETQGLYGIFAPASTPSETIRKIHADLTEITMRPDIQKLLGDRGFEVQGKTAAEFQTIIARETTKWHKIITTAKIKEE
jgi:tripartite-type tricarboxylate transporter receptor subunit TctC